MVKSKYFVVKNHDGFFVKNARTVTKKFENAHKFTLEELVGFGLSAEETVHEVVISLKKVDAFGQLFTGSE
jgi:hypothetical protein